MYILKELPYHYEELEPYIDTHTLALHKNKHQQNYLNKLNEFLVKNNYNYKHNIVELNYHLDLFPKENREEILFNLGGVINHYIYFNSMSPNKTKPNKKFIEKINKEFQSYENFKKVFKDEAMKLKGSGYTYLVIDKDNNVKIINLTNQDNPYNYNLIPLICIDLWEHAYYINYENKKDLYIDNFLEILDFSFANNYFIT